MAKKVKSNVKHLGAVRRKMGTVTRYGKLKSSSGRYKVSSSYDAFTNKNYVSRRKKKR
jgi:hypothetical protein